VWQAAGLSGGAVASDNNRSSSGSPFVSELLIATQVTPAHVIARPNGGEILRIRTAVSGMQTLRIADDEQSRYSVKYLREEIAWLPEILTTQSIVEL
jgi:hypothetical protein